MGEGWKTAGKVLFGGLAMAGAVYAPVLTIGAATGNAALLAGLLTAVGAVGQSIAAGELDEHSRRKPKPPGLLWANHDLRLVVASALRSTLADAANQETLKAWKKQIGYLADKVDDFLAEQPPGELTAAQLPEVLDANAAGEAHVAPEVWPAVIEELARRAKTMAIPEPQKEELARHLAQRFEGFVVETLKEDATGRGPAEGRAWPALQLLFWGLMRASAERIEGGVEELQGQARLQVEELKRVDLKLDELVRWHGSQVTEEDPALAELLRTLGAALSRQIDEIKALFADGLLTPSEFEAAYWREKRVDARVLELWKNPQQAKVICESFVGRTAELDDFDAFLGSGGQWVLHLYGKPGNGKSRLMLAYAERAHAAGRRVYFIEQAPGNLRAAVKSLGPGAPVVLLWDDYRGRPEGAMEAFLGLDYAGGPVIKRVVSTWPTVQVFRDHSHKAQYVQRELEPVGDADAMLGLTKALLPRIADGDAARIVELAEGYPDALLAAVQLVAIGKYSSSALPRNVLEAVDDALIERARTGLGLEAEKVERALLALALTESVDLAVQEEKEAYKQAGVDGRTLGLLAGAHLVGRIDGTRRYELKPDRFRVQLIARAIDGERPDLLDVGPEELAGFAAPLLERWVYSIWGVCVLATGGAEGNAQREPVQRALLATMSGLGEGWSAVRAEQFARNLANSTAVEPKPMRRLALARQIGELLTRFPRLEIARAQALGMFNVTVGRQPPEWCVERAEEIGQLLDLFRAAEIALLKAQALVNATNSERDLMKCMERVAVISSLLGEYQTEEIALSKAQALYNAAVIARDQTERSEIVRDIAELHEHYPTLEIAAVLARGYVNLTAFERNWNRFGAYREATKALLVKYPCIEIAARLAEALFNGAAGTPLAARRVKLAEEIGELHICYSNEAIIVAQVEVLRNAVAVEADPEACLAVCRSIATIRREHAVVAIARIEANALGLTATRKGDQGWRWGLAKDIGKLQVTYGDRTIAIVEAVTLGLVAEVCTDESLSEELRKRVAELVERYGSGEGGEG
ncbi:MAG: hypothetical protein H6509_12225 [Bryobacterales bacterium]|nr:hypothetical protein [Bryobacterales bacterium]